LSFFPLLSLSFFFLEREALPSLPKSGLLLRRVAGSGAVADEPSRLRRRAGVKNSSFFFRLSSSFFSLFPFLHSKVPNKQPKSLDLDFKKKIKKLPFGYKLVQFWTGCVAVIYVVAGLCWKWFLVLFLYDCWCCVLEFCVAVRVVVVRFGFCVCVGR